MLHIRFWLLTWEKQFWKLCGRCTIEINCVPVNFAFTQRLLNLSAETIIFFQKTRPPATCAMFPLKIKETRFFWCLTERFIILRKKLIRKNTLWETCIVLVAVLGGESIFLSKDGERLTKIVSNASNRKRAVTFWIIYLRHKKSNWP